jgi:hypothetical protein
MIVLATYYGKFHVRAAPFPQKSRSSLLVFYCFIMYYIVILKFGQLPYIYPDQFPGRIARLPPFPSPALRPVEKK